MTRTAQQRDDERRLRLASIADADRERELGELTAEEHRRIVERERTAVAALDAERVTDVTSTERAAPRRRRRSLLVVALSCFLLAAGVTLWGTLSRRQPGDSATGSITQSQQAMLNRLLAEGEADIASGNVAAALAAYDSALLIDANNVTALTQSGWFYFSVGSSTKNVEDVRLGIARLRRVVSRAPEQPAGHLYYGIAAASTPGNAALAKAQFRAFLRLRPSAALRAVAAPYLRALQIASP